MKVLIRLLPVIAAAAVGAVVAIALNGGGTSRTTTTVYRPSTGSSLPTAIPTGRSLTINQIYRRDSPGVVDIVVTQQAQNPGGAFGFGGGAQQQQQGEGAGVVYDTSGDILTDEHVVANASSVQVNFSDGHKYSARVLGTDPSTDVAVIRVKAPASELHPIPMANSDAAQVGDPVVAIGSPFSLPETTTEGIVSAVGRSIQAPNGYTITGAIQTDAAINPGNSGGPLLDGNGKVLGLNDQIQTNSGSSAGVGFATPANTDVKIANAIIGGHPIKHAYVGVELNSSSAGGAQIGNVQPNSPASAAGLQNGDVITAVNGKAVSSTAAFITTINNYSPGQTVTLSVRRGGRSRQFKLKLGNRPNTPTTG